MKNRILLFLVIIFLTGCTSNYTLTFNDNEINEKLSLELPNTMDNNLLVNNDFYPLHMNNNEVYNKSVNIKDDSILLNLDYTYTPYDFNNSEMLNLCFHNKDMDINNEDYYYLKLSDFYPCVTALEFDINIVTDNKVLVNNADEVKGNRYIWHVNQNNKDDLLIEIKIAKGIKANNHTKLISYIIIGSIVFIIFIVMIGFLKKSNGRNEI